jgi:hypothetical protein
MMDIENIVLPDETPEADAMEQRLAVDVHNDTGPDTTYVDAISPKFPWVGASCWVDLGFCDGVLTTLSRDGGRRRGVGRLAGAVGWGW